jgi:hypothetical protein
MKIFEIVKEDYESPGLGNETPSDSSSDLASNAPVLSEILDKADYQTLKTVAIGTVTAVAITKLSTEALSKTFTSYAKNLKLYDRAGAILGEKYPTKWVAFLKAAGFFVPVQQLYANLMVNEAFYLQGKYDGAKPNAYEKYKEMREFEWGFFTLQILPKLVTAFISWLLNLTKVTAAALGLTKIVAKVTSKLASKSKNIVIRFIAGFAPKLAIRLGGAGVIAWHGFLVWFQTWIGSDAGRNWAYKYAGGMISTLGMVGDTLWDEVIEAYQDGYKKITGKEPKDLGILPGSKKDVETQKVGGPEAQAAAEKERKEGGAGIYVQDIPVSDAEGFLLPSVKYNHYIKNIRQTAIRKGQPDPLISSGVKLKPGQDWPPLN